MSKLLAVVLWFALTSASAADFTFAAFGDTPYSRDEEARFPDLMAEMNREKLAFIVNIGDIKNATDPCTDELYAQRRQWFDLSHHPLIYTPGDNEWTDCRRSPFDKRDPMERIQKLRSIFNSGADSLGQRPVRLERQKDYPEHQRWEHDSLLCITLNAPGPDNNARLKDEHARREKAQREWISQAFELAHRRNARAVAVFMHGDPWNAIGQPRRGYGALLDTLITATKSFKGEVLLIHGDTHFYRVDRPLGETVPNFTRAEVFGYPVMNWVRIRVREEAGRVRFTVTPGS